MSVVQVAGALAAKTACAAGFNAIGAWISWHPQATIPCVISACVYTAFEFSSIKTQQTLCDDAPRHHLLPKGYQKHQVERIQLLSAIIGATAAAILTPRISQRLGYSMNLKASIAFTLPSLLLSYLTPPSK
eukprot:Platyproteum_vivax@DN14119_c0_g1_i1.p1